MAGADAEQVCLIIEECGGLDKIEALQSHENREIYKLAVDIVKKYFSNDIDNEDVAVAPAQADGVFQFEAGKDLPVDRFTL